MSQAGTIAAAWLYGTAGLIFAGIGGFFVTIRPALLPEDLRLLAAGSTSAIDRVLPRLLSIAVWPAGAPVAGDGSYVVLADARIIASATGTRQYPT